MRARSRRCCQERPPRQHRRDTPPVGAAGVVTVELELLWGWRQRGRDCRSLSCARRGALDLAAAQRRRGDAAQDQRGPRASPIRADQRAATQTMAKSPLRRDISRKADPPAPSAGCESRSAAHLLEGGLEGIVKNSSAATMRSPALEPPAARRARPSRPATRPRDRRARGCRRSCRARASADDRHSRSA